MRDALLAGLAASAGLSALLDRYERALEEETSPATWAALAAEFDVFAAAIEPLATAVTATAEVIEVAQAARLFASGCRALAASGRPGPIRQDATS